MCTLTWHREADGYQLFFNRDERRERKPGIPPAVRRRGTVRFVAPLDGDHGGTWIAVNEFGLVLCLLNGFPAEGQAEVRDPHGFTSRGMLPLAAIASPSANAAAETLRSLELKSFRPFMMVALEPGEGGLLCRWSGRSLSIEPGVPEEQPLVSSSFYTEEVRSNRIAVFRRLVEAAVTEPPTEEHLAFHRSHDPSAGPYSACMHREDASTVSFTRVHVDARRIRCHYAPNSPCRGLPGERPVELKRRAVPAPRAST